MGSGSIEYAHETCGGSGHLPHAAIRMSHHLPATLRGAVRPRYWTDFAEPSCQSTLHDVIDNVQWLVLRKSVVVVEM